MSVNLAIRRPFASPVDEHQAVSELETTLLTQPEVLAELVPAILTGFEEPATYVCPICHGDPFEEDVPQYTYSGIVDHNAGVHLVTAAAIARHWDDVL